MKKQMVQFSVIAVVLIGCVIGYFIMSNYFTNEEKEEEEANKVVAFTLDDYKDTIQFSYINGDDTITLQNDSGTWSILEDSDIKVDSSVVESEMLSQLVEVIAEDKIEDAENTEDYGFTESDGQVTADTNTIMITDKQGTEHVIYIGSENPYDSSLYYMMVEGDDNVYVVSSDFVDIFSKSVDDLEEEETTTEEVTTVVETTTAQTSEEE